MNWQQIIDMLDEHVKAETRFTFEGSSAELAGNLLNHFGYTLMPTRQSVSAITVAVIKKAEQ